MTERTALLAELADKARKLRFDLSLREAKNHRDYRKMKKDIARILTVNREELVITTAAPDKEVNIDGNVKNK